MVKLIPSGRWLAVAASIAVSVAMFHAQEKQPQAAGPVAAQLRGRSARGR